MKLSAGVEWALHCCVLLSQSPAPVPAPRLAEFHGVSATYLAKHLQALARAGLVRSSPGQVGGYALTRAPGDVTLLDVVLAVEGEQPAFRCTEIRQRGPLPAKPEHCTRPCSIARAMWAAEDAWRASLRRVTIADIAADVESVTAGAAFPAARAWLSK